MAKISALPLADALTGLETLPLVQGGATKRSTLSGFIAAVVPFLQNWYKGDKGDTGPAASTFTSMAAMKAAPVTNASYVLASALGPVVYSYVAGDFTGQADEINVVALNGVAITSGALVRQAATGLSYRANGAQSVAVTVSDVLSYSVDVRMFGAVFDGRDNTAALQAAINFAAAGGGSRIVICPAGDCFLSATIRIPSGVGFQGQGSLNTRFRRTGDYGDTFMFGTVFTLGDGSTVTAYNSSGGCGGFAVYQDHGTGMFPPNTVAGGFKNLATKGAHLNIQRDFNVAWFDIVAVGLQYQVRRFGGLQAKHECITTIGIYDQAEPAMQETLAGWLIEGSLAAIPTDVEFLGCRIGGITSPIRSITMPSGDKITDSVQNIGPLYGMQIECAEGIRWSRGYIGACADSGVRFLPSASSILSAVEFRGMFVDSNGVAGFWFDRLRAGTSVDVTWAPSEHNCQGNGWSAGTDEIRNGAPVDNSAYPSVIGFNLEGFYQTFIGFGVWLDSARNVKVNANARNWNCRTFFDSLKNFDCFLRLGGGVNGVAGIIMGGGGPLGDGTAAHDKCVVRYTTDGHGSNPSNVQIIGAAGPGTTFLGSN